MRKNTSPWMWALISLLAVTACSPQVVPTRLPTQPPASAPSPVTQTYSDPFAYCAAVGTLDAPDARYTGPQISDTVILGFKIAAGLQSSTEPMEMLRKTTIWRCMHNQVYACNFGANLPCSSKANTDKTPSPAMTDYCKANPDSDFIPMSVTGHETIFSWRCSQGVPQLLEQIEKVDAAGYLAGIWYPISPNLTPNPEVGAPTVPPSQAPTPAPSAAPATLTPLGGSLQILFASDRGGSYDDLYLLDLTSAQVTRLTQGDSNYFPGPFSPDGFSILFTGFGLTHSYVGVMAADGSNPVNLSQKEVDEGFPAWSPDGKQIVFTTRWDGNNEIYVMNADGSQRRRLTVDPSDDFAPAWSPDGSLIVFASDRNRVAGMYSLYLMTRDGTKVTRLTNDKGSDFTPAWSPDGRQIAFRSTQDGSSDIYLINVDGSGLQDLTNNPAEDWSPAWSPDGTQIAFQTDRDGNWEIYVMDSHGASPRNLTNNPAQDQMPYWR